MSEKEDPKELMRKANEGRRIAALLASADWLELVEPKLAKEQLAAEANTRWKPGMSVDEMPLRGAYYSGAADGIGWFASVLTRAVTDGKEAEAILSAQEGNGK